jgi:hypothetical protein
MRIFFFKFIFALCGVKQKSGYNSSAAQEWQDGSGYLVKRGISGFANNGRYFQFRKTIPALSAVAMQTQAI